MLSDFKGFPQETTDFLRGLALNNNKEWFTEHRQDYERYHLAPAVLFVDALGRELQKLVKGLSYAPKVNGSIFRINRDTRFSKGKAPYKTHLGLIWWKGPFANRTENPGFYFHLEADAMYMAAGTWQFGKQVYAYRDALKTKRGKELVKIAESLAPELSFEGEMLQLYAKGFKDHPMRQLSRHKGLYTEHKDDFGLPDVVRSAELVDYCMAFFSKSIPLVEWLVDLADSTNTGR